MKVKVKLIIYILFKDKVKTIFRKKLSNKYMSCDCYGAVTPKLLP